MARNPGVMLSPSMLATVSANRAILAARTGETVTLDYVKRDGTPTVLTGEIVSLIGTRKGNESTEAVTLLTDKGERSANLWNILAIS